jgi:DNA-binding beta-propeller fold protein YncE
MTAPGDGLSSVNGVGLTSSGSEVFPLSALVGGLQASPFQSSSEPALTKARGRKRSMSPTAVQTRVRSRTKFAHLGTAQAAQVARNAFPAEIEHRLAGGPSLPAGGRIVRYSSDKAAQIELPGGKHAVVESLWPMALETANGQRAPVDLGLTKAGRIYEPVRPLVGVLIPTRLREGVVLPEAGVSLTPVNAQGAPLVGSEGQVDGASVLYANTQTDADTVVRPTTSGVETNTILRSVNSPEQLNLRVGMPHGASLVQAHGAAGNGSVQVMSEGQAIASIRPPAATDAEGTRVPVSMSVKGDLLALTVASHGGQYLWPLMVDPEVVKDKSLGPSECHKEGEPERISSNWCWHAKEEARFEHRWEGSSAVRMTNEHAAAGEYTVMAYHTQGDSKIYKAEVETAGSVFGGIAKLELARKRSAEEGEVERSSEIAKHQGYSLTTTSVCANAECSDTGGSEENLAAFKLEALEPSSVSGTLAGARVYIAQETAPEVTFNYSSPTIEGRTNVFYHGESGATSWLSPTQGAFEVKAHDAGVGIAWAQVVVESMRLEEPIYQEGKCNGVQCKDNYSTVVTYNQKMNEAQSVEWDAENLAGRVEGCESCLGLISKAFQVLKVDAKPPSKVEVSGWPASREISAAPHVLTISATDEAPKEHLSSGVKSISVSVDDGPEASLSGVSCSPGTCTGSGKFTLDAEALSEGMHRLVVTATDNAGNVAAKEFTFDVRHGSPVPVGSGTVDPTSGQFKLSATDVSLAGAGAVSRVYESRDLTLGAEGPLGPQWALSLGGGEGLTVLPTGSLVLSGSSGGKTTFTRNAKGEFEPPLGDSGLKVEAEEAEKGKGITEYLLTDASAGTTTRFAQPQGIENTVPVYANSFGAEGAGLRSPESEAVDSSGDVWVTDDSDDRIEEFSPAGVLIQSDGYYGSAQGEFVGPWGIAINQVNGNVYVTDQGNSRIEEFSASGNFLQTMGWGVTDGKNEFEICTSYCRAGIAGSGPGQFNVLAGVAVDASGNVWAVDYGDDRIEEFNEKGTYVQSFGTKGKGEVEFEGPLNVAFSGGKLYVTDYGNDRVQELSTAGKYEGQFGKEGTGNGEFTQPRGISTDPHTGDLYVTDSGNARVQEFTAAGKFIAKFGSAGSGGGQLSEPTGVVVGSAGDVFVSDYNNHRVEEWTRPTWLPKYAEGPLKSTIAAYAYTPVEEEAKTVIEPREELAPAPTGVTCVNESGELEVKALKTGCRAVTFEYAKTTGATGETPTQWGSYTGRLEKVSLIAYNPTTKTMPETPVAEYAYDSKGRLRAEWDPRISPTLKTTYGYDVEGHVTTITPTGQEPWAFTYGTIAGDSSTGRLMKVTRAPASAALWGGGAPYDYKPPQLSGSQVVGVTMGVSTGEWSNNPVAYGYQWEDCNEAGGECMPILGATNPNYTVQASDAGHTLVAQVTATNGGGSVTAASAPSDPGPAGAVFASAFGSYGSGDGQFWHPEGVAVDAKGNLWVVDQENDRVQEFNGTGEFLKAFGSKGSGNGQLSLPAGLALDGKGDVWVADGGNYRVEEFNEKGEYVRAFGSKGTGSGQFAEYGPSGIAVDAHGNVWVTDKHGGRVEVFNEKGEYQKSVGSKGTGAGQLEEPMAVAIAPSGNAWVTDWVNNRVTEFTEKGEYVREVGSEGPGDGQFERPYAIAVEADGNVWVGDSYNQRVQEFNEKGEYLNQFGQAGYEPDQFGFYPGYGLAVDSKGDIWASDPTNNRIAKWHVPGYTTFQSVFGSYGSGTGQFWHPADVQVDAKGNLWVVDQENDRVQEFNGTGEFEKAFGSKGSGSGQLYIPAALALDGKGDVWVADGGNYRVEEFNEKGEYVQAFGSKGTGSGQFGEYGPSGIAVDGHGNVWVTDKSAGRIEVFNEKGEYEKTVASKGTGAGQLEDPLAIAIGPGGNAWVTDWANNRVTEFNEKGEYVREFGSEGKGNGQFERPLGIAIDSSGDVWVGDSYNQRIQEFNEKGEYISEFGSAGYEPDEFGFYPQYGITVDSKGDLWASDPTNNRIAKWNVTSGSVEGKQYAPGPGTTIEYNVPLSGSGAPQQMSESEIAKWGQKKEETPAYAAAIFAPNEPMGWPASDYKSATVDYMDEEGRTVNVATPSGGISTAEYNEANEVTRTLSADNRAVALKEGSKSAGVAATLDTKTEYSLDDSEILKVVGPEHKIKLATGEEVEARSVSHDYYDEGSEEAEEKFQETYSLLTKTITSALLSSGEEADKRETVTSYSGQGDLGWKLRKPTSTAFEPATLDLVHKTIYEGNAETSNGNVIETRAPAGNSEQVSPPSFSLRFGGTGVGNGQFKEPWSVALDSSGNVWALDTGNDRVEKFSATGGFDAVFGKEGTGNLQFKEPKGIAIDESTGNVYIADSANNRIEELSSSGAFVEVIGWGVSDGKSELEVCKASCKAGIAGSGKGQFSGPQGLTFDVEGDIWVTDTGNDRVEGLSESGAFLTQFGSKGSGNGQFTEPTGVAMSEGSFYVVDHGDDRIEQFSTLGAYVGQFGSKGSGPAQFTEPYGIVTNPSTGVLFVCDAGNERMQEFSPAGKFLTEWGTWGVTHEQSFPRGVAVGSTGDLYVIDHAADEVGEWTPPEAGGAQLSFSTQFGSTGTGSGQFKEPAAVTLDGNGNAWVTDFGDDRIEKFGPDGSFSAAYGKEGAGEVQFKGPTGIAVNKSTSDVYIADTGNNRIEELSSSGTYVAAFGTSGSGTLKQPAGVAIDSSGNVWVADEGNDRIVEFSSTGIYIAAYGKEGSGALQFNKPVAIGFSGENVYVADSANHRVEELTNKGTYVRAWGVEGTGSSEFRTPEGIAIDAAGNVYVSDLNADHVEQFSPTGVYRATFGSLGSGEGQFTHPEGVAMDPASDLYVADQGDNRVERWDSDEQAAHDLKTVYYSAKEESPVAACRNHPEWANLPCQTEPAAQPDHGLPEVPVATIASYNMWDEAEVTEEKFGSGSKAVVRKKVQTYDSAGRALTSEETATPATDTALPKVTNEYSAETGALVRQSTSEGTVTSKYNTLGALIEYTDAGGNVAKYTYEEGGDGRLEEVSEGKGEEAKSSQTYSYNTTTGFMEKLVDSAAGTFTASYDVEGKMTGETYPNAMTATTTYNSLGQATNLVYEKTTGCASKCPETWFSDSVVPSIHGETLQQTSTLASENYAYDHAGRLTETQETPVGKGCAVRLYAYDEEGNRTSETERGPGTEGKCATTGGTTEWHTYDEANRLTDENVVYETFGNTTKMPAGDAGGHEIVSTYYVDNQTASQEQNKQLLDYKYDPAGRTLETASENKETKAKANFISHYAGSGNALTWTCEEEDKNECAEGRGKWSRNIPGIDGGLDAIEEDGKPTILEIHDLQGNTVGAVEDSESVSKLASTYNSTEFGVPQSGTTPPKYAWLGSLGVSSEPSQGAGLSSRGGGSYVPQVARSLQTAPVVPPGAFPNGQGTGSQYGSEIPGWYSSLSSAESAETVIEYAAKLEAERKQAEKEAREDWEKDERENAEIGQRNAENEEAYYYQQAQALAEEQEAEVEEGTSATIASYKLRLNVGCLESGFWTYCSGKYHGKWFNSKETTDPHTKGTSFSTGDRVAAGGIGVGIFIKGGLQGAACLTAAAATPEDEGWPFLPVELHCAQSAFTNMALGAAGVLASIFGEV